MNSTPRLRLAVNCLAAFIFLATSTSRLSAAEPRLEEIELGSIRNIHAFGPILLCGQPSAEDLMASKERGVKVFVTLRTEGEVGWDESAAVEELGLDFHRFGFRAPETLTEEIIDNSLKHLANANKKPVMLYCASANRVGAIWMAHRILHDGLTIEKARAEAKTVGLRTPGYEKIVLAYVEKQQNENAAAKEKARDEKSVPPGINDRFLDPNLKIEEWIGRFEVESREVFVARDEVLKICNIQPGQRVADVGAGTGLYTRLFAGAVGPEGWVYAVDISPKFLEYINGKLKEEKIPNVTSVLCTDRSVQLPPNSVDVVFICDTYHHFEHPNMTLASIRKALKPGGTLIVIDFDRIPGKSREFLLKHVRAGKEVFRAEIVDAGFTLMEEVQIPAFEENYLLKFSKE